MNTINLKLLISWQKFCPLISLKNIDFNQYRTKVLKSGSNITWNKQSKYGNQEIIYQKVVLHHCPNFHMAIRQVTN